MVKIGKNWQKLRNNFNSITITTMTNVVVVDHNNCIGGSFNALLPYVQSSDDFFKKQADESRKMNRTKRTKRRPNVSPQLNEDTKPPKSTESTLKEKEQPKEVKFKPTKPRKAPSPRALKTSTTGIKTTVVDVTMDTKSGMTTLSDPLVVEKTEDKDSNPRRSERLAPRYARVKNKISK